MSTERLTGSAASTGLVAAALLVVAFGLGATAAGQDKQAKEEPLKVSAEDLSQAYNSDTAKANAKYQGKVLVIEGRILGAGTLGGVYVDLAGYKEKDGQPRVVCVMQKGAKVDSFKKGEKVTIKGKCKGDIGTGNVEVRDCQVVK